MAITLASVVKKYSVDELMNYFEEIPYLSTAVKLFKERHSKQSTIITKIVKYCKENSVSQKVAEHLDLLNAVVKQGTCEWQVYEFTDQTRYFEEANNPDLLMSRIANKLQLGYTASCQYVMREGILWFRAYVANPIVKHQDTVMHAAHNLHTNIIVGRFSNNHEKKAILKAVASAFNYENYKEMQLTGLCVRSLMRLHSERNNHGYKMKSVHRNLLQSLVAENTEFKNAKRKKKNKSDVDQYIDDTFGAFQQPRLQKVQFDIQKPFNFTTQSTGSESELFHCKVIFEGPSVLEGFREMVKDGVATHPLPKHVETIRASGKSIIQLR